MGAQYRDPNRREVRWVFYERSFFQSFDRRRTHRFPWFCGFSFFCGSGRQRQFLFLFQSRQHPQVVRQDLPGYRHFPMFKSFGAQRTP